MIMASETRPIAVPVGSIWDDHRVFQRPECDALEPIDSWDIGGADEGKMFCNHCNSEVEPIEVTDRDGEVVDATGP